VPSTSSSRILGEIDDHSDPHESSSFSRLWFTEPSTHLTSHHARSSSVLKMLIRLFVLLAAVAPHAFADVEFTTPSAGATAAGGEVLKVAWKESGSSPPISSLLTYQLFLCAGGNDASSFVRIQPSFVQSFLRDSEKGNTDTVPDSDPTGANRRKCTI